MPPSHSFWTLNCWSTYLNISAILMKVINSNTEFLLKMWWKSLGKQISSWLFYPKMQTNVIYIWWNEKSTTVTLLGLGKDSWMYKKSKFYKQILKIEISFKIYRESKNSKYQFCCFHKMIRALESSVISSV